MNTEEFLEKFRGKGGLPAERELAIRIVDEVLNGVYGYKLQGDDYYKAEDALTKVIALFFGVSPVRGYSSERMP